MIHYLADGALVNTPAGLAEISGVSFDGERLQGYAVMILKTRKFDFYAPEDVSLHSEAE